MPAFCFSFNGEVSFRRLTLPEIFGNSALSLIVSLNCSVLWLLFQSRLLSVYIFVLLEELDYFCLQFGVSLHLGKYCVWGKTNVWGFHKTSIWVNNRKKNIGRSYLEKVLKVSFIWIKFAFGLSFNLVKILIWISFKLEKLYME